MVAAARGILDNAGEKATGGLSESVALQFPSEFFKMVARLNFDLSNRGYSRDPMGESGIAGR
jgi:hypothetical protein